MEFKRVGRLEVPRTAAALLKGLASFLLRYPNKRRKVHFAAGRANFDPARTELAEEYGAAHTLRQIRGAILYDGLRYDQILAIMEKSKYFVPYPSSAPCAILDAIASGCMPIVYRGISCWKTAEERGLLGDSETPGARVEELLSRFEEDDTLYTDTLLAYQEAIKNHRAESVVDQFYHIYNAALEAGNA